MRVNILLLPVIALMATQAWAAFAFALAGSLVLLVRHRRETDDRLQLARSHATVREKNAS